MTLSMPRVRHYLRECNLEKLFIEELGWDRHSAQLAVAVDGHTYTLNAIAEKRGVQIFQCQPDAARAAFPTMLPAANLKRRSPNQPTSISSFLSMPPGPRKSGSGWHVNRASPPPIASTTITRSTSLAMRSSRSWKPSPFH